MSNENTPGTPDAAEHASRTPGKPVPADIAATLGFEVEQLVRIVSPGPGWTREYSYEVTVRRVLPDGTVVEDTFTAEPVAVRS